ncbi:pyruvate dehydrogenase (acetyl-transferring) kinase, mitochondrial [Tanacetum coccineum]
MSTRARSTDTSDGLAAIQVQLNNLRREIKKVNERVYVAQVGCESCGGPHYTKDCLLKEEGKTFEEVYYTQFEVPFPQGERYRAAAPGFYQRDHGNPSYQERRQIMEESLSKLMAKSAKRHDENSNLIKEIQASMDAAIRNQGASIKALEIQIGKISKALVDLGASINVMSYSTFTNLGLGELTPTKLIIELADRTIKCPKGIVENIIVGLRERMELDLEARLMGEALILNRSLDPTYGDYIELNDLNKPLELRRNQVEDLGLTIEESEVINEPMEDIFSGMIVVENMDVYRDERMGDVIIGKPFCQEVCVKAKRSQYGVSWFMDKVYGLPVQF